MKKIDYKEELEKINKHYNDICGDIYPFICKNRVTILKSGFYKKMNGDYYGLSAVYNVHEDKHMAVLINYVYVPQNYLIIPESLEMNEKKEELIKKYKGLGYEVKERTPAFPMYTFSENTFEYEVAINNLKKFIKDDKLSHEQNL